MKKTIWFIVNPISGVRRKDDIPGLIHAHLDHELFNYEIRYTTHKGHAIDIALACCFDAASFTMILFL